MPQSSYYYAVARIRALERGLIGRERMLRIADSTLDDAMRLLHETGYGNMPDATAAECELLIEQERIKAAAVVKEVSPEPAVTDLFLLRTDVLNLKMLIKARLMETQQEPRLLTGGVYANELLMRAVRERDYRDLPKDFRNALDVLELTLFTQKEPQLVSVTLDKAYLTHAYNTLKKYANATALAWFRAMADFNNVLTLLRLRQMDASQADLNSMLLPAGDISHSTLAAALDLPDDGLEKALATGAAGSAIAQGLAQTLATGRASALEKVRDNYLLDIYKRQKYDVMSLQPIIGYLLAREQEEKCVRLIFTAKLNGLDTQVITERLRELYG